jgi:hypothetical protein
MLQATTLGLCIVLVLVIVYQYYKISEGFNVPAVPQQPVPASAPTVPASASAAQPTVTQTIAPTSAEAAIAKEKQDRANLLRDIQEVVRNELLQQQKLTSSSSQPILRAGADGNRMMSPATAQGRELSTSREKLCPKDMNEYIRKDSIPCWNCTLDY